MSSPENRIAFQGEPGAYGHLACKAAFPEMEPLPCAAFEDVFEAVNEGRARLALIPIENSIAGRVADIHHLMPGSRLHIIGEHFQPVNHHLLALPGTRISDIKIVKSHVHALGQCRKFLGQHGLKPVVAADTAGSAAEVAAKGDKTLAANIEDAEHNTTRFLVMSRDPAPPPPKTVPSVTTFIFRVRNVPAALYKAMGGFATNGVNMTKLESYQVGGTFAATQFYADVEGHPDDIGLRHALEELEFFSREVRILGVYPAHPYRFGARVAAD